MYKFGLDLPITNLLKKMSRFLRKKKKKKKKNLKVSKFET
jgi:hypothetical protein